MIPRLVFVLTLALAATQQKNPPASKVDDAKVDAAIRKGVEYLKSHAGKGGGGRHSARELILLAWAHAGLRTSDPDFNTLFQAMLQDELTATYRVSLQAMVLEEVDRVRHQNRIFQCAQFLVDNQGQNGQWSYGSPTTYPDPGTKDVATVGAGPQPGQVVIFGDPEPGQKPPVQRKIPVKKQREGPDRGDNSNSQYAALGLRACHDAGILLPKEVVQKAAQWWRESQEGSGVASPPPKGAPVATGGGSNVPPRGWSYQHKGGAYGSMTAGAVGALAICDHILGVDWKRDDNVNSGVNWIRDNFSVTENPRHGNRHHYYYLYGLERAGMLYGTEKFGAHEWYVEGARYLLEAQEADGGWGNAIDTCFAILFLRRATRALVESSDAGKGKK